MTRKWLNDFVEQVGINSIFKPLIEAADKILLRREAAAEKFYDQRTSQVIEKVY